MPYATDRHGSAGERGLLFPDSQSMVGGDVMAAKSAIDCVSLNLFYVAPLNSKENVSSMTDRRDFFDFAKTRYQSLEKWNAPM